MDVQEGGFEEIHPTRRRSCETFTARRILRASPPAAGPHIDGWVDWGLYSGGLGVTGDAFESHLGARVWILLCFWSQWVAKGSQVEVIWETCGPLFAIR